MALSKHPGVGPALLLEATGAHVELNSLIAESWDLSSTFDAVRAAIVELVNAENASRIESLRNNAEASRRIAAVNDSILALQLQEESLKNRIEDAVRDVGTLTLRLEDGARAEGSSPGVDEGAGEVVGGDGGGDDSLTEPGAAPQLEIFLDPSQPSAPRLKAIRRSVLDEALGAPVTIVHAVEESYVCQENEAVVDINEVANSLRLENKAVHRSAIVCPTHILDLIIADEERGVKSPTDDKEPDKGNEIVPEADEEEDEDEQDQQDPDNPATISPKQEKRMRRQSIEKASLQPGQVACSADFAAELDFRLTCLERNFSNFSAQSDVHTLVEKEDSFKSDKVDEEELPVTASPVVDVASEVEKAIASVVNRLEDAKSMQVALCSNLYAELNAWAQEKGSVLEGCQELIDAGGKDYELRSIGDTEGPLPASAKTLLQHQSHFQDKGKAVAQAERSAVALRTDFEALSERVEESIQTALANLRSELQHEIAAAVEPLVAAQSGGAIEEATEEISKLKASLLQENRAREDSERSIQKSQGDTESMVRALQEAVSAMEWKQEHRQRVDGQELSLDADDIADKLNKKANRLELQSMEHETIEIRKMVDRLQANTNKLQQQYDKPAEQALPQEVPCLIGAKCLACGRPSEIPKFAGSLDMDLFLTEQQKDVLSHGPRGAHHSAGSKAPPSLEPIIGAMTKPLPKPPPQFLLPEDIERRQALIHAKQQLEKSRSLPGLDPLAKQAKKDNRLPALPNVPTMTATMTDTLSSWGSWKKN